MTITGSGDITVTVSDNNYVVSASIPTFTESDPVFNASPAATITASDISRWNASGGGNYGDADVEDLIKEQFGMSRIDFEWQVGTVSTASEFATPLQPDEWEDNTALTIDEFVAKYYGLQISFWYYDENQNQVFVGDVFWPAVNGNQAVYTYTFNESIRYDAIIETDIDPITSDDIGNPKLVGFTVYDINNETYETVELNDYAIGLHSTTPLSDTFLTQTANTPEYIRFNMGAYSEEQWAPAVGNTYQITYNNGTFVVNYPRSEWEALGAEDLNIYLDWGSGSVDTTPVEYTNEHSNNQIYFANDTNGNPLTDSIPLNLSQITITVWLHPSGNSSTAYWIGNDTWEYQDSNSSGEWVTTYHPFDAHWMPIDNNTITVSGGVLVATVSGGGGGIATESDPVFSASPAASITTTDISNWNTLQGVPSASSASAGDVLTVSGGSAIWAAPQGGLPTTSTANEGDVLTVDRGGDAVWAKPAFGHKPLITFKASPEVPILFRNGDSEEMVLRANMDDGFFEIGRMGVDERDEPVFNGSTIATEQSQYVEEDEGVNKTTYERELASEGVGFTREYAEWDREADDYVMVDNNVAGITAEHGINILHDSYRDGRLFVTDTAYIDAYGIGFSTEEDDGEGGTITTVVDWSMNAIQLKDQTTGDIYELTIDNGQIVLNNISQ